MLKHFPQLLVKEKSFFYYLVILMLIASFLEAFSLLSLFPFLKFISTGDAYQDLFFLKTNDLNVIIFLFLFFFILRNIFLLFYNWVLNTYLADTEKKISTKLLSKYLTLDYLSFKNNNSSNFIQNLTSEVHIYVFNIVLSYLTIISEFLAILLIFTVLLLINFKVTITIFILFIFFSFILNSFLNTYLLFLGQQRSKHDKLRIFYSQESFKFIQLILFKKLQNLFISKFDIANTKLFKSVRMLNFIQIIPKIFFEIFLVTILVLFLFFYDYTLFRTEIIFTLGIYLAAIYRLLPSFNKIIGSFQKIKSARISKKIIESDIFGNTNLFKEDFTHKFKGKGKDLTLPTLLTRNSFHCGMKIQLKNISFRYKNNKEYLFKDLNFDFKIGDIIGIKGNSGLGKSTLLNIILGLIKPTSGSVLLDGVKIEKILDQWRNNVSFVSQNNKIIDDSLHNNIIIEKYHIKFDYSKFRKVIKNLLLKNIILRKRLGENGYKISEGQKQKVMLARALFGDPMILFLDEATNALDKKTENLIINNLLMYKNKKSIIFITHNEILLSKCDKIIDLNKYI